MRRVVRFRGMGEGADLEELEDIVFDFKLGEGRVKFFPFYVGYILHNKTIRS